MELAVSFGGNTPLCLCLYVCATFVLNIYRGDGARIMAAIGVHGLN